MQGRVPSGGFVLAEAPRVLLYIASDSSRVSDVVSSFDRLEESGAEITSVAGHAAGRSALQSGAISVLVLDGALGLTACLYLMREGRTRNPLDAIFILGGGDSRLDENVLTDAGASCIYERDALVVRCRNALFPKQPAQNLRESALPAVDDLRAFMGRISHEIRTPLHGIHGAMDLLEDTGMSPLQREYASIVRNAADALMSVVNDLVDYANPRQPQGESESFPFEIRTCAERVAVVIGPKALGKGLDFVHLTHHDLPWRVKGNPNTLRQVLGGLAGHLIRHAGQGLVILEIGLQQSVEESPILCFEIGVKAAEFGGDSLRSDGPNSQATDDSDVSLERCGELVTTLGGQLHTRMSSSGTMQFEFSVAFEAVPDKLPLLEIGPEALDGREVLIVDDTATNRLVYREQLANWGCNIVEASSAKEALALIEARAARGECFDIALVDFAMPEMNGGELATAIRALPNGADMRLILCTSTPKGGDALRMTEAGFEAYLTKPVRFDCLRKVMCLLLGGRESERERTPLITQHVVAEMDRAARSVLHVGDIAASGRDAIIAVQNHGFPCDTARFGDDAAHALGTHRYAAVLVDCRPSLDSGLAAVADIRASDSGKRIPLIMTLKKADADQQSACLTAGGDVVLVDPIQRDELVSVLNAYLGLEEQETFDESTDEWDMGDPIMDEETSDATPIDLDRLEEVTAGDEELRQELIEMFLEDTKQRFAAIESAIADEDGESLNRTAHSINGSSASMGASTLQALALELESLGSENRFDEAPALFSNLKNEYEVVKVFFGTL